MNTTTLTFSKKISDIWVMAKRSLLKIKHTPDKLFDVTIMPIFFMIMFSYLFGGAIAGDIQSYLPTIIPGILIQTLLSASASTGTQLREDIDTGVFDRFKSLPIARIAPLAGPLVADALRYLLASAIALTTGFIIGWRPEAGFLWTALATLLAVFTSWSISWIFAFLGLLAKNAGTIQGVSTLIMFALSFLSNAFVPIDTLPNFLQTFAKINPVTHIISAFREMTTAGQITIDVVWTLGLSLLIVAIFAPLTLRIYTKKI